MTDRRSDPPVDAPLPSGDETWQRLHPGTILDDALQRIPNVLIGLFLILTSGGGDAVFEVLQLVIGFAAIFPVVVRYLTGRYRVDRELVQWRMGVFTKVHTDLPRHRIQSVDTRISAVGRMLGLESVIVSSAGGEGEIRIGLVDGTTAERLRTELAPDADSSTDADDPRRLDDVRSTTEPAVELASLGQSDLGRVVAVEVGRVFSIVALGLMGAGLLAAFVMGLIGPGSLVVWLPALLSVASIGRGLVTEAIGFSSSLRKDRILVSRGIVARSTFEAPLARVQGLNVKRSPVARRIGTERISVDTADVSDEGNRNPGRAQTLVHPIAEDGTWPTWARMFLRSDPPGPDRFRRVAPVSLRRRWFAVLRFAIVVWVVIAIGAAIVGSRIEGDAVVVGMAIALGLVIPGWLGLLETFRYRNERWALDADQLAFRGGAFTTTMSVIPRARTQGTAISANWFQRRLGVADLVVDTASPTVGGTGRDLHLGDAESVAGAVLTSADRGGGV